MPVIEAANPLEVCTKDDPASTKVDGERGLSAVGHLLLPIIRFRTGKSEPLSISIFWHFAIFFASCCVVVLRRPDMILHAQFYAEDGAIWYAMAYNHGWWRVLFSPYQGYLHLLPRLTAGLALVVPMVYAPLVENLVAIAIQALPVNLLVSPRLVRWGALRFRVILALLYLILPNTREMPGTVTESQWFLALSAFFLLTALPAKSLAGRIFDASLLVLCSLTGPFSILLFPVALTLWMGNRKDAWLKVATAILLAGALVQSAFLFTQHAGRLHPPLGANADSFVRILGTQVYLGTILGGNGVSDHLSLAAATAIAVIGTALLIACLAASGRELRALVVFSALLFSASLVSPTVFLPANITTAWHLLEVLPGMRYWFFPCLAFAWSLIYGIRSSHRALRVTCWCLLALMPLGLARDFRYPAFSDLHFADFVRQVDAVATGSTVAIPIRPYGWQATLIKH